MIKIINGNILNCIEDIIVHQVNVDGIMEGGLAKQIASQYPKVEKEYIKFCDKNNFVYENLKGKVLIIKENSKNIANIFSQKPNFDTDYQSMQVALEKVRKYTEEHNLSVAIPFKIGCGIANGDWELVLDVINKAFKDYEVVIYRLEK